MEEIKQITTIDEDGNEVNLVLLDIVTVDDQDYALLMAEEDIDSEEPETVLMRLKTEGEDEEKFLSLLDEMTEQAFDDQCTGANPRYPLMKEIKQIYLNAYYGVKGEY